MAWTISGVMKAWSLMGVCGSAGGLGGVAAGSDLDQARYVAAWCKGNPVGIDPGGIAVLVPGQDGCPFDHCDPDVVGKANLHADARQVGEGSAQILLDLGRDGLKIGCPIRPSLALTSSAARRWLPVTSIAFTLNVLAVAMV